MAVARTQGDYVTEVSINGRPPVPGELTTEMERIDVTREISVKPDPAWEHVDGQGHYHAWTADGELPTLTARTEHRPCDGVHRFPMAEPCEGYDVTLYACSVCDEDIEPGTVTRHRVPEWISGREDWTVVVRDFVRDDDRVSVRVDTGEQVLFGFAIATDRMMDSEGGAQTTLVGASALGRRKPQRELATT